MSEVRTTRFNGQVVAWNGPKAALQAAGFAPGAAYPGEAGGPARAMTVDTAAHGRVQIARQGAEWVVTRALPSAVVRARRDRAFQGLLRSIGA